MGNAVEFKPEHGAFSVVAKRRGVSRQAVQQAYNQGKNATLMTEVVKASIQIKKDQAAQWQKYAKTLRKAKEIADAVSSGIEE